MARTAARKRDPGKGAPRRTAAQGGQVQSLDRALSILERLAEEDGMTLTDLAQSVGLAPSTTHRLLTTLQQRRFADFDEEYSVRSEEHTSELQSLMRISYAVFCLNKKNHDTRQIKL